MLMWCLNDGAAEWGSEVSLSSRLILKTAGVWRQGASVTWTLPIQMNFAPLTMNAVNNASVSHKVNKQIYKILRKLWIVQFKRHIIYIVELDWPDFTNIIIWFSPRLWLWSKCSKSRLLLSIQSILQKLQGKESFNSHFLLWMITFKPLLTRRVKRILPLVPE